jgi:SAM-dependent methyltransferase
MANKEDFDTIKCCLCGGGSHRIVYDTRRSDSSISDHYKITDHDPNASLRVVSCRNCGFSFLNPRIASSAIIENYTSMDDEDYLKEEAGRRSAARLILKRLKKYKEVGTLLDIGCATGFLLDEARKMGWDVYGVELSQWAADYAQETLGLKNVIRGTLKEAPFPRGFFDAVIMTDVIEHLIDPKEMLYDIRQILKPNGILCSTTPDIDSPVSKLLKAKWWGIKGLHLYYFNKSTMRKILDATGYYPLAMKSYARTFSLGYWFSNLAKYKPSMTFLAEFLKKRPKAASFSICLDLGDQLVSFARRSRKMKYLSELEYEPEVSSKAPQRKVAVVLPAYNAAKTLAITVKDIPKDIVGEIILVDDMSTDNTAEVARELGIKVIRHDENKGYGANQKTCYQAALESGADIAVMVHPDYQYDPTAIPRLIEPIVQGKADAVFGSRMMKGGALLGGMPLWKYNANILLTAFENVAFGVYLTEYHSGFRAYSRKYLLNVNYEANSDSFVFDTEIIAQGVLKFMRFDEVPIRTRYFDEASSIKFFPSVIYGLRILWTIIKFKAHKCGWRIKQF